MGGGGNTGSPGSGQSSSSSSQSSSSGSVPLSQRSHPAQWALYGPTAAMLFEKAFGGTRDKQIMETNLRDKAFSNSVGGAQRWGNSMASQGVAPQSGVNAAVNRGLQTQLVGSLAGASSQAEQAQRAQNNDYAKIVSSLVGNWAPTESWSNSQGTTQSTGSQTGSSMQQSGGK
jgi:hypothetical protein